MGPRRRRGGGGGPWGGGPGRPGQPGSGWFGGLFEPPPRADRGGVRYLVLDAVAAQPRHGYEIMQAVETRSGGAYRPSPGVVYPTLQLLEELGHVRTEEQEARKVYAITDDGRRDLAEHQAEVDEFYARLGDDAWPRQLQDFAELIHRAVHALKAFKRAARRGTLDPSAQARIHKVLEGAIEQIDAILRERER